MITNTLQNITKKYNKHDLLSILKKKKPYKLKLANLSDYNNTVLDTNLNFFIKKKRLLFPTLSLPLSLTFSTVNQ